MEQGKQIEQLKADLRIKRIIASNEEKVKNQKLFNEINEQAN